MKCFRKRKLRRENHFCWAMQWQRYIHTDSGLACEKRASFSAIQSMWFVYAAIISSTCFYFAHASFHLSFACFLFRLFQLFRLLLLLMLVIVAGYCHKQSAKSHMESLKNKPNSRMLFILKRSETNFINRIQKRRRWWRRWKKKKIIRNEKQQRWTYWHQLRQQQFTLPPSTGDCLGKHSLQTDRPSPKHLNGKTWSPK